MKNLINDFTTHPLVPGSVLGSIIGEPKARETQPLDEPALLSLNKMTVVEIVGYFQNVGLLNAEQAGKILATDKEFIAAYKTLSANVTEIAEVTGCDRTSVERLARSLFGAKLGRASCRERL